MADNAPDAPADAPADTPMDGETPPGEEEDEECLDPGRFFRIHDYRATGSADKTLLHIYKAMVGAKKFKELPSDYKERKKAFAALLKSDAGLELRLLRHRRDEVKRFNAKHRAEQEESDEASSDDDSAPAPVQPRRSTRDCAGQLKEEPKRCGECNACLSMVRPPPDCGCSTCRRGRGCAVVKQARENPPRCEKLAQDNLPAVGADEQGSVHLGDPTTRERLKLQDMAELIRENSDADLKKLAADSKTEQGTTALLNLAVPGMPASVAYVLSLLGEDATKADLGEHVATHLKLCTYLDDDEKTRNEIIRVARAAAIAPDVEPEPPANRSIMLRRAWVRIAKALHDQQRGEILALPKGSAALTTWLRTRAQFAVDRRSERTAIAGALSDWTLDAARKANRENMWTEKAKGERHNNTEPFRLARNKTGRTDVTDNVKRLRETGPPPPSARKEKK